MHSHTRITKNDFFLNKYIFTMSYQYPENAYNFIRVMPVKYCRWIKWRKDIKLYNKIIIGNSYDIIISEVVNLDNINKKNVLIKSTEDDFTVSLIPDDFNLSNIYSMNVINSTIPPSICDLLQLVTLDFSGAYITGSIPLNIGNLINLIEIDMSNTEISGIIPDSFYNLINIKNIHLSNTKITGPILPAIKNLQQLGVLAIDNASITGTIPNEICKLVNLDILHLSNNLITGYIPHEIGNLAKLEYLALSYNDISGDIPDSILELKNLVGIKLEHTKLYTSTEIYEKILDLPNVTHIDM